MEMSYIYMTSYLFVSVRSPVFLPIIYTYMFCKVGENDWLKSGFMITVHKGGKRISALNGTIHEIISTLSIGNSNCLKAHYSTVLCQIRFFLDIWDTTK